MRWWFPLWPFSLEYAYRCLLFVYKNHTALFLFTDVFIQRLWDILFDLQTDPVNAKDYMMALFHLQSLVKNSFFFWAANKLWAVIMPFSHLSTWFIWWPDFFRRSLYSNWLFCFGLQMFHLMPTPQGSFYVFNDIFRLNYAWRVEIVSWFVLTEMSKNWTTIWKFRFF